MCGMCYYSYSMGNKFHPVSNFMKLHVLTLASCSLYGQAEAKLNRSSWICDCVWNFSHAAARGSNDPKGKFFKFDALRSLRRAILEPSSALPVALGRLDFWFNLHGTSTCVEYMVWFQHRLYFCTNTNLLQTLSMCAAKSWAWNREWGLR